MTEVEQALLIILSSALAVFLVLGIISTVLLIQVLGSVKRLGKRAESIGEIIEDTARSVTSMKILSTILGLFSNRNKRR